MSQTGVGSEKELQLLLARKTESRPRICFRFRVVTIPTKTRNAKRSPSGDPDIPNAMNPIQYQGIVPDDSIMRYCHELEPF